MGTYRLADGVQQDKVGEELVLCHPNGNLYILNETGGFILEASLKHNSQKEIAALLAEAYDAPFDTICQDVQKCLSDLAQKGLIKEEGFVEQAHD